MPTNNQFERAARWLHYAEEDLITAEIVLKQPHLPPRQAYWYALQTTEKALKAVLIFLQIDFPRTDDLSVLWNLVPHSWQLKTVQLDVVNLTGCIVVDVQYSEDTPEPTKTDAFTAVEQARAV